MIRLLVLLIMMSGLPACSSAGSRGTIQIMASWTDQEEKKFLKMLEPFETKEKIDVEYVGTRALSQVLQSEVRKGTPPDIAVLPSPAELANYARNNHLVALDEIVTSGRDEYSDQWLKLEKVKLLEEPATEKRYAVTVKADLKSAIWFNPKALPGPKPQTGEELLALTRNLADNGRSPWCMGMGATPDSGWPGTDWIEDILLHQAGPDVYRKWAASQLEWTTSPEVRQAWETWGQLAGGKTLRGGPKSAMLTDFRDAGRPLFSGQPGCLLDHQASFIMGVYEGYDAAPKAEQDFDFFPFPTFGDTRRAQVVSADLAAMFNNTPQAVKLLNYLASEQAQRIWPQNGAFSANRKVEPSVYGNAVSKKVAATLTSDESLCFDASDLMAPKMRTAFYRAALEYVDDPTRLDALLNKLETVRKGVPDKERLELPCR